MDLLLLKQLKDEAIGIKDVPAFFRLKIYTYLLDNYGVKGSRTDPKFIKLKRLIKDYGLIVAEKQHLALLKFQEEIKANKSVQNFPKSKPVKVLKTNIDEGRDWVLE